MGVDWEALWDNPPPPPPPVDHVQTKGGWGCAVTALALGAGLAAALGAGAWGVVETAKAMF